MTKGAGNSKAGTEDPKRAGPPGNSRQTRRRTSAGFTYGSSSDFGLPFLIPPVILFTYFHLQFHSTLKESGELHLRDMFDPEFNVQWTPENDQGRTCQHRFCGLQGARDYADIAEVLAQEPAASGPQQREQDTRTSRGRA